METKTIARIIDRVDGYGISDDSLDYIDETGPVYPTVRAAIAAAREAGYSHYIGVNKNRTRKL